MTQKVELKIYKEKSILDITEKNALYCIKGDNDATFRIFVTDKFGNIVYLKDDTGGGGGTITDIISSDATLEISETIVKDIKIASSVLSTINSALQAGDNVSALVNDSNYITLADIPAFNPSNYDLSDFTNTSVDRFAKLSDITSSGSTNLGYTASPTQGSVTSDTGTDATIPLANNTNAGLLSPTEKSKLATIADGAEVNVNADWNATSGDAQILNKPDLSQFETTSELNTRDTNNRNRANHTGTQLSSTISDFDTAVSSNTNVSANTSARHTHTNKTLLDTYTQTEADLADSVSKKHTHSNLTALDAVSGTNTGDETNSSILTKIGFTPEDSANKVTSMTGNTTSNTVFLTAKAVYDWVTGLLANASTAGIMKLFTSTGTATDGTMTQKAITDELATKAHLAVLTDISSTATYTGWASFTTKETYVLDYGSCAVVIFRIDGVSNSATTNVTLPFTNTGGSTVNQIRVQNNSSFQSAPGNCQIGNGSSTLTFVLNNTGGGFTPSGNKSVWGQITILK